MAKGRKIEVSEIDNTATCVHLSGSWYLEDGLPANQELDRHIQTASATHSICFDTKGLGGWDSSLVTFLVGLIDGCRRLGARIDYTGLPEGIQRLIALEQAVPEATARAEARLPWLARRGQGVGSAWGSVVGALSFLGETTLAFGRLFTGRARHRRSDFYREVEQAGAQALPIITLIGLLLGMILAFVGGVTLHQYGATTYLANLVAIAVVRELGAIMTAIVMAGRTGSAYAAEIGSMRVDQEIDAFVTMGIPPMDFIVLNRLVALMLMMPLLCVYADFLGIFGGGIVAVKVFGLTAAQYAHEIRRSIRLTTFAVGIGKSAVFGIIVAMCGCMAGLQAGRSAAAVGRAATSAVVNAIVLTIVADGLFAVTFFVLGV